MALQITGVSVVYSTICSGGDQRKYQSSASLVFVRGIHRWPVNPPHKGPVTRKMLPLFHFSFVRFRLMTNTDSMGRMNKYIIVATLCLYTVTLNVIVLNVTELWRNMKYISLNIYLRFLSLLYTETKSIYRQISNISRTLVGNKIFDHSHLHSQLNTWLQCIGRRQPRDMTRII